MPIYQCFSPEGRLDESARSSLAEEITRIHCDATGIPRSYVNVMFTDVLRDVAEVQAVTADELRGEVAVEGDAVLRLEGHGLRS